LGGVGLQIVERGFGNRERIRLAEYGKGIGGIVHTTILELVF
jgi:hypothetical protein